MATSRPRLSRFALRRWPVWPALMAGVLGCGTTRWSDTPRTATEQLLISDAVDRAVSELDFRALSGRRVYLDGECVKTIADSPYLNSTIRQQMLAAGCIVLDKREDADYIVEVRAGALGTDRNDLLYGVPATQIPTIVPAPGVPTAIPEIPLVKKTNQRGVAKVAVFAYNRQTGRPVWQSGVMLGESKARNSWVLGAGPFQSGNIYDGTRFAGSKLDVPLLHPGSRDEKNLVSVADQAFFVEPAEELALRPAKPAKDDTPPPSAPSSPKPAAPASPPAPASPLPPANPTPPANTPPPNIPAPLTARVPAHPPP